MKHWDTQDGDYIWRIKSKRDGKLMNQHKPVVTGTVPYLGHRPDPKHEARRVAEMIRQARRTG